MLRLIAQSLSVAAQRQCVSVHSTVSGALDRRGGVREKWSRQAKCLVIRGGFF